jgi:hypothetical protein
MPRLFVITAAVFLFTGCDDTLFGVPVGGASEVDSGGDGGGDGGTGGGDDSDPGDDSGGSGAAPTWYQDLRPIFATRCWGCHSEGGGNFSLEDYSVAAGMTPLITPKVQGDDEQPRYMPPFGARETSECSPVGEYLDDWRLTDGELELYLAWVDAGTPEGDEATAAPAEAPEVAPLEGEGIEVYTLPEAEVPPGDDLYVCFSLPLDHDTTRWIDGVEVLPDNTAVVHHVVLFTDPLGETAAAPDPYPCYGGPAVSQSQVIFAWAPGGQPMTLPADSGVAMEPGARLIVQLHYHPVSTDSTDQSALAVRWIDEQPQWLARMEVYGALLERNATSSYLADGEFLIPAGATGHVETWRQPLGLSGERRVWGVFPHMHEIGQDILITVDGAAGERCLSHNDRWDFNWQLTYRFAGDHGDLPALYEDDELVIRCTYDNTTDQDMHVGEDTTDEMCLAIVGLLEPSGAEAEALARLVYLVDDGPEIDVYVDDTLAVSGLSPGQGTGYTALTPGAYTVTLTARGASPDAPSAVQFGPVTFSSDYPTTLAAFGEPGDVRGASLADDGDNIAPEDVRLQALHAAPEWPSVDVLTGSGDLLLQGFSLGDVRTAPDRPAGSYPLGIDVDGDGDAEATFTLPALDGGAAYNLFLVGDDGVPYLLVQHPDGTLDAVGAD